MFVHDTIAYRLKRGCETMAYPQGPAPALPDRHGGALTVNGSLCPVDCNACLPVCPTKAITRQDAKPVVLDLGRCIFCAACVETCPEQAITQTNDHRMAVGQREDLLRGGAGKEQIRLAAAFDEKLRKLLGRSLRLRQVSAGGCAACEADTNVLGTIGWDLGRFGIQFVASPRHADGLLITGPVTRNMEQALRKTYDAVARPKIVIAVGACALAGGPFVGHPQVHNGASAIVPVDLFIPGCPPHPLTILDGLLRLVGGVFREDNRRAPLAPRETPTAMPAEDGTV
jgi:Ni,Fe-hydrogenase III small subunit/formate hydrogenlyase subunit 6/NADH:ubiquinone oxidoreductase subunit I